MGTCTNCKLKQQLPGNLFVCEKWPVPHVAKKCEFWKGKNKYNNVKTKIGDVTFDSKKEAAKYNELKLLEKSGVIKNLQRQVRFEIVPKQPNERAAYYVADFVYETSEGKKICEDVKSAITRQNPVYVLKRKLFKNIYKDYEFRES